MFAMFEEKACRKSVVWFDLKPDAVLFDGDDGRLLDPCPRLRGCRFGRSLATEATAIFTETFDVHGFNAVRVQRFEDRVRTRSDLLLGPLRIVVHVQHDGGSVTIDINASDAVTPAVEQS